jgi:uncharacterized C2H2 Zn-finger protein
MFNFHKSSLLKKNSCDYCGKNFRTLEGMMRHFQIAHDTKIYECRKCNMKFEGMELMRNHIRKNHSYKKNINTLFG